MNMKVLVLTTIRAPYRVDLFNELGKKIDLTVCFEQEHDIIRDKSWYQNDFINFKCIILRNADKSLRRIKFDFLKILKKNDYDIVLFYEYSTITSIVSMIYCLVNKVKYAINCDGAIKHRYMLRDCLKSFFIKKATACLANGISAKQYFLIHKAKPNKIYEHYFSSYYDNEVLREIISEEEKTKIRKKLNLPDNATLVLTVGNFVENKGFDILLESFCSLKKNNSLFLLLIGSGKLKSKFEEFIDINKMKNVYIIDFQDKYMLQNYFKASDIFVFPTLTDVWGLVVVEAMSLGLPIISSKNANSSIELIKNGINGYLIENKAEIFIDKIIYLSKNKELMQFMANNNLTIASKYTIENNAKKHLNNLSQILGENNDFT